MAANHTGRVKEPDTDTADRTHVGAVLGHSGEALDRGALAEDVHDVRLGDAPEQGCGADLVGDQDRQTGDAEAVLHELDQVPVRARGLLEQRDSLSRRRGDDPARQLRARRDGGVTGLDERIQVRQSRSGVDGAVGDGLQAVRTP